LKVSLLQFYGIEIDDFAVRIAQLAMWLTEHQMNMKFSQTFGKYYARIPLKDSAKIICANSLEIAWEELLQEITDTKEDKPKEIPKKHQKKEKSVKNSLFDATPPETKSTEILPARPKQYNYILGNPPFIGKQFQNEEQKQDIEATFAGFSNIGVLDYVACWYLKAAQYIKNTKIKCAFVSTNSVAQGEQTAVLWNILFREYRIKIHFAHRTFSWSNEASDNAVVHCVIIGFANFDSPTKYIFDFDSDFTNLYSKKVVIL
jgi:type I restriction-modification system DNA methylase subunit